MGKRQRRKKKPESALGPSSLQHGDREDPYPYSLSEQAERVFLKELESVLDIALWRADEIEFYMKEQSEAGHFRDQSPPMGRWVKRVSGETRLFGSVEAFFSAWARASLILYPTRDGNPLRGRHLRAVLGLGYGLGSEEYRDRHLRDGWMHLDEDIDRIIGMGGAAPSSVTTKDVEWYHLAIAGSVRVIDPVKVAVALPLRSVALLRPYFHRAETLRQHVVVRLNNEYAWTTCDGVSGIVVLRREKDRQFFFIKALGIEANITVEAPTVPELKKAFEARVKEWRLSSPADTIADHTMKHD